jgi:hypothetical protein
MAGLAEILDQSGYTVSIQSLCHKTWTSHGCQAKHGLGQCIVCDEDDKGDFIKGFISDQANTFKKWDSELEGIRTEAIAADELFSSEESRGKDSYSDDAGRVLIRTAMMSRRTSIPISVMCQLASLKQCSTS